MATHSSNKDPMAKVYLLVGLVLILAAVYYLVSSLVSTIGRNSLKGEIDTISLVANKTAMIQSVISPVGSVTTSDGSGTVAAGPSRSGEEVYTAVCQACHGTGAAGAPKVDDKAAWEPRVANGLEALIEVAISGKGAMPARGGQNVPDGELQAAIVYMTTKAGFNLKPKANAKTASKEVAQEADGKKKAEKTVQPKSGFSPAVDEVAVKTVTTKVVEPAAIVPVSKSVTSISGEKIYKSTCFACHDMGVAGAPKVGDKVLWKPRIATGNEAMYDSAINGKISSVGVMPPKGGNLSLSDNEVKAAVDYMTSQSQ